MVNANPTGAMAAFNIVAKPNYSPAEAMEPRVDSIEKISLIIFKEPPSCIGAQIS